MASKLLLFADRSHLFKAVKITGHWAHETLFGQKVNDIAAWEHKSTISTSSGLIIDVI